MVYEGVITGSCCGIVRPIVPGVNGGGINGDGLGLVWVSFGGISTPLLARKRTERGIVGSGDWDEICGSAWYWRQREVEYGSIGTLMVLGVVVEDIELSELGRLVFGLAVVTSERGRPGGLPIMHALG